MPSSMQTVFIVIPLVSFICYCVLLAILIGSRKNKITRHYTYYIVAMIIWSLGAFVMRTDYPPGPVFWNRILCTGLILMPVIFYDFALVLTDSLHQRGKLVFGYVSAGMLLICNFAGLITEKAFIENGVFQYKLGSMASVMAIWSLCYLLLALFNIVNRVKSGAIPFIRVKYIIAGLLLVIAGGLLNLLPDLGKYPLDIVSNTINAIFIAYSIYRYKFLEIKLIVKKGIAYSLYTLVLTGVYIITVFVVEKLLSQIMGYTTIASALILAVLLAFVFQPIKNAIQNWIDSLFYKGKPNHRALLKEFSEVINNVLDLEELTESMFNLMSKVLKPKRISLFLRHGKEEYRLFQTTGPQPKPNIKYGINHPIIQWFQKGKTLLTIGDIESLPFFTGLWSMEKKDLYTLEAELIIPIRLREQLTGFFILSEKKGGEAYGQEEMDLVYTMMNNAAVVIENAQMYEDAKKQAITDGLTKLYNHRYFHEVLAENVAQTDRIFSVALIDVDFFKLYNDLYGHSAGDKALAKIGEVLRQATREEDIIARYGGEEFAILFPGLEGSESLKAIETIRKAVENSFMSSEEAGEFLTVSIGVACFPRHGTSSEELLVNADLAMYEAKRSGRNQCVLFASKESARTPHVSGDTFHMQNSVKSAYFSAIYALAATIDAKDHYTYGHSENVCRYAVALARAAGFDEERVDIVKNAGLLHDIGKIGVPENILTKALALTEDEYEVMKRHVDISIAIIKHVPSLIKVIPAIMSHHERYDGTGYPRGSKGESIPIEGRCLCIVDAFDAMTTDRPYRKALSIERAIEELKKNSGTQFDPKLTEIFTSLFETGVIQVA